MISTTKLCLSLSFAVKRKPGPAPIMKRRKELKDGEFDVDSVMPWKLDFNTTEKEATFWLWEQKWRTFYNFIGKLHVIQILGASRISVSTTKLDIRFMNKICMSQHIK